MEKEQLVYELNSFLQGVKQRQDIVSVIKIVEILKQLCERRASVQIKVLSSLVCFICRDTITYKQYKQMETLKLACNCNQHCHNLCLKNQIFLQKDQISSLDRIVELLNENIKCKNNCNQNMITPQIVNRVLKNKDLEMFIIDYTESKQQEEQKVNENQQQEQEVKVFECGICYDDIDFSQNGFHLKCGCMFCKDCLKYSLNDQVKNNMNLEIDKLTCPQQHCQQKLSFEDITLILKEEKDIVAKIEQKNIFTMFENLKKENPDSKEVLISCPGKYIEEEGGDDIIYINQDLIDKQRQGKQNIPLKEKQKIVDCDFKFIQDRSIKEKIRHKCEKCKYQFCLNNCDDLHQGYTCSQYQTAKLDKNKDYKKELEAQGLKFCPNCNVLTFRISGCDRITCVNCNKSYCWVCYFLAETAGEVYAHMRLGHK